MIKKFSAILIAAIMPIILLAGCGNPIHNDLQNFLNSEMTEINNNYEKIKAEAATWEGFEKEEDFISSLQNILIPLVNDSIKKLTNVTPKTEEVTAAKNKYLETMTAYKDGFEAILEGFKTADENKINTGNQKLNKALELLNEYNAELEALAAKCGLVIEY